MIYSMTGYGKKEKSEAGCCFSVDIRSLNNRYLDIQIKLPRSLAALEPRVKKTIQDRFSRGRFDVCISRNGGNEKPGRLSVDESLVGQYIGILKDLKTRFGLAGDLDVQTVAGLQNLITFSEEREEEDSLWQLIAECLVQALDDLQRMRAQEGAALAQDIRARLATVGHAVQTISSQAPVTVEAARNRMTETLGRLLKAPTDPVRLAQEIAILAERTDVTEELIRLGSHLEQFRSLLDGSVPEAIGKKLDFFLQEIGREINTIASKAMNAQISLAVVNVKAELEKIREQVQNIE